MGFLHKERSRTPYVAAALIALATTYAAGYYKGADSALALTGEKVAEAKKLAYEAGKHDQDWKQLIKTNQETLNRACTSWWFGSTTLDRKIVLPRK